jgi:hypothetical protein
VYPQESVYRANPEPLSRGGSADLDANAFEAARQVLRRAGEALFQTAAQRGR